MKRLMWLGATPLGVGADPLSKFWRTPAGGSVRDRLPARLSLSRYLTVVPDEAGIGAVERRLRS